MRPFGSFALSDHLVPLSETSDPLEALDEVMDLKQFRELLEQALGHADGSKGGGSSYEPLMLFKVLNPAARHTASDERIDSLIPWSSELAASARLRVGC